MADTPSRTPRALEARDKTARVEYQPPSMLPDPASSDDWAYHWVRTHLMGESDPANASMQLRDGWTPVRAEDHPELASAVNAKGNVEIGGLILCKMPIERYRARQRYFRNRAQQQMESVDSTFLSGSDPRMPKFSERQSSVERGTRFGSGS